MEPLLTVLGLAAIAYWLIAPGIAWYKASTARRELAELKGIIADLRAQVHSLHTRLDRREGTLAPPPPPTSAPVIVNSAPTVPSPSTYAPPALPSAGIAPATFAASASSTPTAGPRQPPPSAPEVHATPSQVPLPPPIVEAVRASEPKKAVSPQPQQNANSLEQFLGVKLFAWIGGLALFLGIVFFVKYAFERNLISPALRTTIGFLIGGGLVAAGVIMRQSKAYAVLAQTLAATGVLILYGVTFAAHALYHFPAFGTLSTFAFMALITAVAFGLALRMEAQVIAVLGMAGGFLTPVLVNTGEDNPFGLFGYVLLLDLGLMAVAKKRAWHYLIACAAGGTLLLEAGWFLEWFWKGQYQHDAKVWLPMGVQVFFPALFAGATWWLGQDRSRLHRPAQSTSLHPALGGLALAVWSFVVAFIFLGHESITSRPLVLNGFLFAINAAVLAQIWLQPRTAMAQWIAALLSFVHLAVWSQSRLTEGTLIAALVSYLMFGLMHTGFALLAMRMKPETMRAQRHGIWLGPVAVLLVIAPLFALPDVSWMIWPTVLLLNLMTIAVAAITLSTAPLLLALCVTLLAMGVWLFRLDAAHSPWGFLFTLGGFALVFAAAGAVLSARLRKQTGAAPRTGSAWLTSLEGLLPMCSAALPFFLLIITTQKLALVNPTPVFTLGLLLSLGFLALMRIARLPALGVAALVCMGALEYAWFFTRYDSSDPWLALGWFIGIASLFAVYAFVWCARFTEVALPWIVSACSWLVQFPLIYLVFERSLPNDFMGLVPGAFAVAALVSLALVSKMPAPADLGVRHSQLAWFGGIALFFITLIFPIQFDHQWLTLAWALEGAALCWLYTRVPHYGLRKVGVGLLVTTFVRLAVNPAVLSYQERTGAPIWNWFLYTYGIAALAQFAAGWWLAPPRDRMGTLNVRTLL